MWRKRRSRARHLIGCAPLIQYGIQIESMSVWTFSRVYWGHQRRCCCFFCLIKLKALCGTAAPLCQEFHIGLCFSNIVSLFLWEIIKEPIQSWTRLLFKQMAQVSLHRQNTRTVRATKIPSQSFQFDRSKICQGKDKLSAETDPGPSPGPSVGPNPLLSSQWWQWEDEKRSGLLNYDPFKRRGHSRAQR